MSVQKNIVVVGGGTAGWVSALYVNKVFPEHKVTLVESERIGILGAGEGTVPYVTDFFQYLEIPVSDLIKNSKATLKNGIKFTGWSGVNEVYTHPFGSFCPASTDNDFSYNRYENIVTAYDHILAYKNKNTGAGHIFMEKLMEANKVPLIHNNNVYVNNPIDLFNLQGFYALHFNANELASFLRKVGESRGIKRVEGEVVGVDFDDSDNIVRIKTKDSEIECFFVIDCTGFRRLFIGEYYKQKWKPHKEHLPAKKAVPFFLPITKDIPPYTEAVAMKYGWMWKIPVQDRYGCGYVFDSDFISDDQAKKEVDDYLGFEVESPRTFSFDAGCYENIWVNNCLAVGLSSGFLEPLEATSIYQSVLVLERFLSDKSNLTSTNKFIKREFNKKYLQDTQEIVDFLYLHYVTNRTDTDFWKNFTKNNTVPDFVEYILGVAEDRPISSFDFEDKHIFPLSSYAHILYGNKILSNKTLDRYLRFCSEAIERQYFVILNLQDTFVENCVDHSEFISIMKTE